MERTISAVVYVSLVVYYDTLIILQIYVICFKVKFALSRSTMRVSGMTQ